MARRINLSGADLHLIAIVLLIISMLLVLGWMGYDRTVNHERITVYVYDKWLDVDCDKDSCTTRYYAETLQRGELEVTTRQKYGRIRIDEDNNITISGRVFPIISDVHLEGR